MEREGSNSRLICVHPCLSVVGLSFYFSAAVSIIVKLLTLDNMAEPTNIYEAERRAKLQKLRELGIDPYGGRVENVRSLREIKDSFKPEMGHEGGPIVKGAGRVMLKRS